jgi:hypothetical protein
LESASRPGQEENLAKINTLTKIYFALILVGISIIEGASSGSPTMTEPLPPPFAASSQHLAVCAESGGVNMYSEQASQKKKTPLRSIMNLHTSSAECLRFKNRDGQILTMSTQREQHGLKVMHVPSRTIFSNWPTSKTPLNYFWRVDFSPQSRFMAIGNDKGKCLLCQLNHYQGG